MVWKPRFESEEQAANRSRGPFYERLTIGRFRGRSDGVRQLDVVQGVVGIIRFVENAVGNPGLKGFNSHDASRRLKPASQTWTALYFRLILLINVLI